LRLRPLDFQSFWVATIGKDGSHRLTIDGLSDTRVDLSPKRLLVVKFDSLPLLRGPHLTGDNLLISPPAVVMKMTQQSDPSTPESPGAGYKAVMVAVYEQAFRTFFPFVLVRNHRSFHSDVSQTLVRPGKDNISVVALEIKPLGLTVSQGPIHPVDTK
jgi:hypothetical protein